MKKKIALLNGLFTLMVIIAYGQIDKYNTTDLHPVSPTAFQFLKYTDIPVSEYSGVPNISIPLYKISVDEVTIPVELMYHSGGVRVTEEAGWAGLGWDLEMGSIIQEINDRDDYETDTIAFGPIQKRRPDFFTNNGDGSPQILPLYHPEPNTAINGTGWSNPYPISSPTAQQGFAVATNYYVPVNGVFDQIQEHLFDSRQYDSEPDIFVASFFGQTVKFILDFKNSPASSEIVVLNKGGYKVIKTTDGFLIYSPEGTRYYFEKKSTILNTTSGKSIEGPFGSTNEPTSNIYLLTQIITVKGKAITFDYWETSSQTSYTTSSAKLQHLSSPSVFGYHPLPPGGIGGYQFDNIDARANYMYPASNTYSTYSYMTESYKYLKSINFPNGRIDFKVSDRSDIVGGKKLDSVYVSNIDDKEIELYTFNYSYFDASSIIGNGYGYNDSDTSLNSYSYSALRLKLNSVNQNDGGIYNFYYDSTLLPKKNSYAVDYWGFYNGQLSNTSFVPNPIAVGDSALGDNGNNKNSSLTYTKAGTLQSIRYPTGGKVVFDYELNQFGGSQMNMFGSAPVSVQGNGLRIHSISHFTDSSSSVPSLKTVYSYGGGKLLSALHLIRDLPYIALESVDLDDMYSNYYTLTEVSSNGVFSSNPLSPGSGVGYDTVSKTEVDRNNISKGKTITLFANTSDVHDPTIETLVLNCSLPDLKSISSPENGSPLKISYYDDQNQLQKTISNTYNVVSSDIYYGARIIGYGSLHYALIFDDAVHEYSMPQYLIGYYPIYDVKTFPSVSTTTEYDGHGDTLIQAHETGFNSYDLLVFDETRTSTGGYRENTYRYISDYPEDTMSIYAPSGSEHMLNLPASALIRTRQADYYEYVDKAKYGMQYENAGGNVVISQSSIEAHPGINSLPEITTYDQYDSSANVLQLTTKGQVNSFLWDYNREYVTAEIKNASQSDLAYTSFEAQSKGNWSYTGSVNTDISAPTGTKSYNLSGGNISKSSLNTAGNYIVSYWSKNGQQTVSGSGTVITGRSVGSWTYYEHPVANPSGGTITVSGSGTIDELRLYPKGAMMATYTYQPLIGITSECDVNNRITYYEYDSANRLALVRDLDKNIVRRICYNYAGQPESCHFNTIYLNADTSKAFTKNNCSSGQLGTVVSYSISRGKYVSAISQHAVDSLVAADFSANGQSYANSIGSCACDTTVCTPLVVGHKCINGVCETGTLVCISSVFDSGKGNWICTYHYRYSDCSEDAAYTTSSPTHCLLDFPCH